MRPKKVENPIKIHAQQSEGKAFGDPRLIKRGQHYTKQWENIIESTFFGWKLALGLLVCTP